jgi:5'-3' exonuclease
LIPDYLALVGDAANGFPGIAGIGAVGPARLLSRHDTIEAFTAGVLGDRVEQALLFKRLATLRSMSVPRDLAQAAITGQSSSSHFLPRPPAMAAAS